MRVLVDTNIWIDHLRKTEPVLVDLLERDQVCVHQSVITELALGNLKNRSIILKALERLMIVRNVDDQGVRHLVEERRLWDRGLSAVDAALLASVVVTPGVSLWTRDKRLRQAARDVGVLAELLGSLFYGGMALIGGCNVDTYERFGSFSGTSQAFTGPVCNQLMGCGRHRIRRSLSAAVRLLCDIEGWGGNNEPGCCL